MNSTLLPLLLAFIAGPTEVGANHAPWYEDRKQLLYFKNEQGKSEPVKSKEDWSIRVKHIQANMELMMGPLPKTTLLPLDMKIKGEEKLRHYSRMHVTFTLEKEDSMFAYLLVPNGLGESDRRPGIICLPGSSSAGKDTPAGLSNSMGFSYAHELAERGYVCLVLDYPMLHRQEYKTDPYKMGYESCTMKGIVNHRRGVDLLQSLPFVDGKAIGVIGHSLGGHNALFLASFDPRVKAIVSSCGFNVFAKHNKGDVRAWSSNYYMPRIKTKYGDDPAKIPFDFTEVLAALAPRAVFINAPLHDEPDFEVSGVRDCLEAALPIYRKIFDLADRIEISYPDAGHSFPLKERILAYDFFDRNLLAPKKSEDLTHGLKLHLPLKNNSQDVSGNQHHGLSTGQVLFQEGKPYATFTGKNSWLDIPPLSLKDLNQSDFSIALWMKSDPITLGSTGGDIFSWYDSALSRGINLSLKSNLGVTTNQPNFRHLQFGIDDRKHSGWLDCGKPGNALSAFALAVHQNCLYAGTCEPGANQSGRVYRFAGDKRWIDCGNPGLSNSVMALAVHENELYAGTGKYRLAGSALVESPNKTLGGKVFRYGGGSRWVDCGQLPDTEAVGGLVVFKGKLFASSLYKPAGFFRYEGEKKWIKCATPSAIKLDPPLLGAQKSPDNLRVEALTVHEGFLYASSYDGGYVFRFDGENWTNLGRLGDNTQTYSFSAYQGKLLVGTWPSGKVFRFENPNQWTDLGRLGDELEVMGMMVHNGRLLAGTLPHAEIFDYQGNSSWKKITRLDFTPDVKYRRAWTMAEHDGQLFCSALPSGKIFSFEAGANTSWGHSLPEGWHHVAAVKSSDRLFLFLDGKKVAQSALFKPDAFQILNSGAIRIGVGCHQPFLGDLADFRIYNRVLNAPEILKLAQVQP